MDKQVAIDALETAISVAEAAYAELVMALAVAEHAKRGDGARTLADTQAVAEAAARLATLEAARDFLDELDDD